MSEILPHKVDDQSLSARRDAVLKMEWVQIERKIRAAEALYKKALLRLRISFAIRLSAALTAILLHFFIHLSWFISLPLAILAFWPEIPMFIVIGAFFLFRVMIPDHIQDRKRGRLRSR